VRPNRTKQRLDAGEVVFGGIISGFAPEVVELLGHLAFDFVFLDCEHGPMSYDQVEQCARAAEATGITPIVRVPNHEESTILRYLDRGVQGIIVPHVNTRAQAERVTQAARYHPEGRRGAAGGRAHEYNVHASAAETRRSINEQLLVIPMCEETEAVANLDEILAVPGVDAIHSAASDLGQSMGNPPLEEVRAVMRDVVGRVRAAGKHAGVGGSNPADTAGVAGLVDAGANIITVSTLGLLRLAAEGFRADVLAARSRG
jgi:2-keto-3-deoxy-L-rhamnonate aldolase RhmA